MRTSEVLNTAVEVIRERGWARGSWGFGDGPLCIEGAIVVGSGVTGTPLARQLAAEGCPAVEAVRDYLDGQEPFLWNDDRGRTAAEVIEVLRAAALVEHAKEQAREQVSA